MVGEVIVRWTIRGSLICLAAVLLGQLWLALDRRRLSSPSAQSVLATLRAIWTLGALLSLTHALSAFHSYHHWSHAHAFAATARETQEVVGVAVGAGIYLNYLFVLVWLADVILWWKLGAAYQLRSRGWARFVWGYLSFIALNGAVVFETGPTRWGGIVASALLAILGIRYWWLSSRSRSEIQA